MNTIILASLLSAGTALTNTTTETVLASASLSAKTLQAGQILRLHSVVRATATNSTDTLRVRLRIGGTTLTGTVCVDSGAVDVANNDLIVMDLQLGVRTAGASGVLVVSGFATILGAEGTVTGRAAFEAVSVDTTAALKVEVTGVWSAASASDSAQSESFTLTVAA